MDMKDTYKSNIIQNHFAAMTENEYYMVRLKGDSGKAINLDWYALRLIQAYYDGIITEKQIEDL